MSPDIASLRDIDSSADLSRALLASVARTNISTLQAGLAKQEVYWNGIAWVMAALDKRIEGFSDVDLEGVTAKLQSFVSLPDGGLIGAEKPAEFSFGKSQSNPADRRSPLTVRSGVGRDADGSSMGYELV